MRKMNIKVENIKITRKENNKITKNANNVNPAFISVGNSKNDKCKECKEITDEGVEEVDYAVYLRNYKGLE